jgi:hypothetical protein
MINNLRGEILSSGILELGSPFQHHYAPANMCKGGRLTTDSFMERGLDKRGYDCSGLVIQSICDAIGIGVDR